MDILKNYDDIVTENIVPDFYSDTFLINENLNIKYDLLSGEQYLREPYMVELIQTLIQSNISDKNRKLLAVLKKIKQNPDDKDLEWWDEYFKELEENKLSF